MDKKATSYEILSARIISAQSTLPKRLAEAASYVLANADEIALGTTASIAKAANVQPSTLVRLAHHLGYDGFSDLQSVFRERLMARASTYEERLARLESGTTADTFDGTVMHGFINAARESVDRLAAQVSDADFARAVTVLARARTIYLIARRRSYPLTAHLSYGFGKLGIKTVMVSSTNGLDEEIVALAEPDDAAFICSFAPYASDTVALANRIHRRKVPIVAITDSPLSPLAPISQVRLEIAENDYSGFRSISASMAIVAALPVAIAERRRHTQKKSTGL
ncbi:MurR/RpiR family transcriptional regulator [Nitratireductor indicus]|uniref:Sugar isomerase n=1 Tax=Nitratireductor indicus C115 TaxID=1231190 RepID=K2NYU7_9HYPH|nr:MurR/RpiR family transcriptional regulator [Nitratireductor indicus]EKF43029.1 sugar isomerase [Nitratireductor indicus C115]MDS1137585.1 MurR/RpiR family transcriptional regulator [Nitratireductor indicus]SFQ52184.1 transcriptional regulator, RpiR family [Nitratireductor indicus]